MTARENPFSTDRVERVRYRLEADGWDRLLDRLAALGNRGAIVGPEGSGKTTLLEDLAPHLARRGFRCALVRAAEESAAELPEPAGRDFILLDSAERLGFGAWLAFRWRVRRAGGLVITAHRPGRLPTLHRCVTSLELLDRIVERLVPAEAAGLRAITAELFAQRGGNLRAALGDLYDLYAEQEEPAPRAPANA